MTAALLQLVRLFWCEVNWCNCTGCVRTGLAVTLNHHFRSSQWSCEGIPVYSYSTAKRRLKAEVTQGFQMSGKISAKTVTDVSLPILICSPLIHFFFFSLSDRVQDVGVWRLHVARGLFHVSRLWEADRCRGLHPRQKQLLLCAVLWGQVCSTVQPLQEGEPGLMCRMIADVKHLMRS